MRNISAASYHEAHLIIKNNKTFIHYKRYKFTITNRIISGYTLDLNDQLIAQSELREGLFRKELFRHPFLKDVVKEPRLHSQC